MNWLVPAMFASLFWGFGQTFMKRGLQGVSPWISNIFIVIAGLLIEVPFALIGGVKWEYFPLILVFGFFANLPNFAFPYIIAKANVSLAGTIVATYPIYTILLSVFFLKESLDPMQLVGIAGILIGMFLLAKPENNKAKIASWVIWAIVGSVVIGLGDYLGKIAIMKYDLYSFILAFTLASIPCLFITRLFDKTPVSPQGDKKSYIYSMIGNFIMPLGILSLFIAFNNGPASLASPVASTYPIITVVLAYFFLKEKITRSNLFGIALASLGVILLGI